MATLFLALIYATFISLGLPDSLLGVSWPVMQPGLGVPYSFAGIISMIVSGGTIVASFFSGPIIRRFGTGNTTRVSVAMTAIALCGFSLSPSFGWLLLMAIPLGLGGGAVDAALNHFVATHYKANHMNWLHCFWGVGAMSGPLIMSRFIVEGGNWRGGYLTVGIIQGCLVALLLASLPLWRWTERETSSARPALAPAGQQQPTRNAGRDNGRHAQDGNAILDDGGSAEKGNAGLLSVLKLPGVWPVLVAFFSYCGAEATMGLWGSSFLVKARGLDASTAAFWVSLFFGSLTVGRLISGFAAMRTSNASLIRAGLLLILAGAGLMLLPMPGPFSPVGFLLVGLGCAPIYPSMLHETPRRFSADWAPMLMAYRWGSHIQALPFCPRHSGSSPPAGTWLSSPQ
ncbi:MFS transporter [Limnochorda pilosa]|uniref:MFS transporter n=1 Tax=Limnochorda pilosa TaxID=1555112 RepID=A0A0K2SIZ7_LIMPI|nr:MFS transporter [Limnochorda pilosa]BAS26804.1 MFS transporter [Limnochorda pilosa]